MKRTVVCALGVLLWGCTEEPPLNLEVTPEVTPEPEPQPGDDTAEISGDRAQENTFDVHDTYLSATVLRLADVKVFASGELEVRPTPAYRPDGTLATADWNYRLSAPKVGRTDATLVSESAQKTTLNKHTATTRFTNWSVDYKHRPDGLEQIVRVDRRPPGAGDTFTVAFDSPSEFVHQHDDKGSVQVVRNGTELFSWNHLNVFDAKGKSLVARMDVKGGKLRYIVDDREATYPVTIDPLARTPAFTELGSQAGAELGKVAFAGDVNNDGFDDVLVGERRFDMTQNNEGRALVFPGSATGIGSTAIWSVVGGTVAANFGNSLAAVGDVNGDGVDDFAVGATTAGATFVGGVYVFTGGNGAAPSTTAVFSTFGSQVGEIFGSAITAGDYNCDGEVDLAVSSTNWDSPTVDDVGRVVIYPGQATTPFFNDAAPVGIERSDLGGFYGRSLATGNVNGDSIGGNPCDDLLVGGARYSVGPQRRGRADIFFGSATGIDPANIDWTVLGDVVDRRYGFDIDSGVDINGDGFDEILIGGYGAEVVDGRVDMYMGAAMPSTTPAWSVNGGQLTSNFGFSVSFAGDVDNNGFQDILVGAPSYIESGTTRVGSVFVYASAATLPPTSPSWTRTEGNQASQNYGFDTDGAFDANNDGFDDILVGANLYDDGASADSGAAYAYFGTLSCSIGGVVYADGDSNPSNPCEACTTATSTTAFSPVGDGGSCDDNNLCTENDVCNAGVCAGTTRACNDNNPCTDDTCDPTLGCVFDGGPVDGMTCPDDGLSCTNDVCSGGNCTHPVNATDCLISGNCYAAGEALISTPCEQCVPGTSQTAFSPAAAGASCEDGAFCTVNDTCDAGGTCSGAARDCSSVLNECTTATTCSEATDQCIATNPVPNGTACSTSDLCNAGACSFGVCVANNPVDCSAFDTDCTTGVCDPATGTCSGQPVADGTSCDTGNFCLIDGVCSAGTCSGQPRNCDDGNPCTTNICQPVGGCTVSGFSDGTACDDNDGISCTSGTCSMASCVPTITSGSCLINNACFAAGGTDGQNVCRVCDPNTNTQAFSSAPAGTQCQPDACQGDQLIVSECAGMDCGMRLVDCGAYTCNTTINSCFTACLTNAHCEAGAICTSNGTTAGICTTSRPTVVVDGPVVADCGEEVALDGSGSSDPAGLPLQFSWTQTGGPTVALVPSPDQPEVRFTVPTDLTEDVSYTFQLVVSNGAASSDPANWIVAVEACNTGGDMGGDTGTGDMGRDIGFDFPLDVEPTPDLGNPGDAGADQGDAGDAGGSDVGGEPVVKGSGCLCTTTSNYPTDASWILLVALFGIRRRRRA